MDKILKEFSKNEDGTFTVNNVFVEKGSINKKGMQSYKIVIGGCTLVTRSHAFHEAMDEFFKSDLGDNEEQVGFADVWESFFNE